MTDYRCIKCEVIKDENEFFRKRNDYHYGRFCQGCYDNNGNSDLRLFVEAFLSTTRKFFAFPIPNLNRFME